MNLKIEEVSKKYGKDVWGVRSFSCELESGVYGLLGPNGSGKTTLMRIITTVMRPTSGKVYWNGEDSEEMGPRFRSILGYLPQDFGVYKSFSAQKFLMYIAALKGMEGKESKYRVAELLELTGLTQASKRKLGGYSGGMKQRVGIAQALLNDPKLLVVDEPTAGLDPEERIRFRNLISEISGDRIVILSTHIVSDLEASANQIIFIKDGAMKQNKTPEEILHYMEDKVWEVMVSPEAFSRLKASHLLSSTLRAPDGIQARIISESCPHPDARNVPPNLEDAYLHFFNQKEVME